VISIGAAAARPKGRSDQSGRDRSVGPARLGRTAQRDPRTDG